MWATDACDETQMMLACYSSLLLRARWGVEVLERIETTILQVLLLLLHCAILVRHTVSADHVPWYDSLGLCKFQQG